MVARLTVTVGGGQLMYEKRRLKAVMRAAGGEVAAVARSMLGSAGSGRKYYGVGGGSGRYRGGAIKGVHRASAPGSPPAKVTGTLQRSIKVRPYKSGEGVAIRANAFYALFLDPGSAGGIGSGKAGVKGQKNPRDRRGKKISNVGSRVLDPRPFLSRAIEQRGSSIGDRIRQSIAQDIKFVRRKAK